MILDTQKTEWPGVMGAVWSYTREIEALMQQAPFAFHLGGSHYFGCARPLSDFDFLARWTPDTEQWLEANGFARMGSYDGVPSHDKNTVAIYENGRVQVQLVNDLTAVLAARNILSTFYAEQHKAAGGPLRNEMWRVLIEADLAIRNAIAEEDFNFAF